MAKFAHEPTFLLLFAHLPSFHGSEAMIAVAQAWRALDKRWWRRMKRRAWSGKLFAWREI